MYSHAGYILNNSRRVIFICINVIYPWSLQSTTWRHVWWGSGAVNVFYSEQRDFVDSHIDTPAFLFSIILGSAFHAFIILSTWPKATWPHHLSPYGYLYLYSSLSIYLPYAPMCLPPSRACCERNCVCSSIWQSDAKTQARVSYFLLVHLGWFFFMYLCEL